MIECFVFETCDTAYLFLKVAIATTGATTLEDPIPQKRIVSKKNFLNASLKVIFKKKYCFVRTKKQFFLENLGIV